MSKGIIIAGCIGWAVWALVDTDLVAPTAKVDPLCRAEESAGISAMMKWNAKVAEVQKYMDISPAVLASGDEVAAAQFNLILNAQKDILEAANNDLVRATAALKACRGGV